MRRPAVCLALVLPFLATFTRADMGVPRLGAAASPEDVAAYDRFVFPDGAGLPSGSGDVATGAELYTRLCSACHGADGRGGPGGELAGGEQPLTSDTPDKNIGTYWPYATTLFDFIRRAMPLNAPGSLTDNEVYALTAYLLAVNGVIDGKTVLDAAALAAIKMPNRDGFIWIDAIEP